MRRILYSFFALALILGSAPAVHAAALTETQIQAILGMISAFGADSATISNVNASLRGQPATNVTSSNTTSSASGDPRLVGNTSTNQTTTTSTTSSCYNFNSNDSYTRGYNVLLLRKVLSDKGYLKQSSNIEVEDGYNFDENLSGALARFQGAHGITQTGSVGPITRAKLNSLYGCGATTASSNNPAAAGVAPVISSVSPQPVQVGSALTVYFTNGGKAGSVILKNLEGTKSRYVPYYTTGPAYNGFVYYDGTKVTFTVPSSIGRGQLPENSGYEAPISVTPGTYNMSVYSIGTTDGTGSIVKSGGTSNPLPIKIDVPVSVSAPAPIISGTTAKGVSTFEANAGGTLGITGSNLTSPSVFIGGHSASVTQTGDSLIYIAVPSSLTPGQSYELNIVTPHGRSNVIKVKIMGNLGTEIVPPAVSAQAPTITSVSPSTANMGQTTVVTIAGSNFSSGATVQYKNTTSGYSGTITPSSSSSTFLSFSATPSAVGTIIFYVRNADGQVSESKQITVLAAATTTTVTTPAPAAATAPVTNPIITSFTPTSVPSGTNANLLITGSGFKSGAVVVYSGAATGELPASYVSAAGHEVSVGPYVLNTAGAYTFYVRNPDGGRSGVSSVFTVTVPTTNTSPTVSSLSPASYRAGQTGVTVHVLGTNFQSGAQIVITDDPSGNSYSIPATFNSSTDISIVTGTLMEGTYYFYVRNPDGKTSSLSSIGVGPSLTASVFHAFRKAAAWF